MFYQAFELFEQFKYSECLGMFEEISLNTEDPKFKYWSLVFLGRCKRKLSIPGELSHFEEAMSLFPDRAEAIFEMGNSHYLHRNFEEAEKFLKMSYSCDKNHQCIRYEFEKYFEEPHEILIDIYLRQKRFNEAEELITGLILNGRKDLYNVKNAEHNLLYSRFFNNAGLEFMKSRTIQTSDTLIIQLTNGYDGLGDNLVFSHIPRIAKESGKFKRVLISNQNKYKGEDYPKLVWETNPYVDGFTDLPGTYSSIQMNRVLDKWNNIHDSLNLMDSIMLLHNLDDGKRNHMPECYYKPKVIESLKDKVIFDVGTKTLNTSIINKDKLTSILKENGIFPDYIVGASTHENSIKLEGVEQLNPASIWDWADMMYSAKHYVCFNSGGYWLSGALGIKAKHIWVETKNLPAWSFLDHENIKIDVE